MLRLRHDDADERRDRGDKHGTGGRPKDERTPVRSVPRLEDLVESFHDRASVTSLAFNSRPRVRRERNEQKAIPDVSNAQRECVQRDRDDNEDGDSFKESVSKRPPSWKCVRTEIWEPTGKFFGGLALLALPFVVMFITGRLFFWLLGIGVLGLFFAANAVFSIGDKKNDWE